MKNEGELRSEGGLWSLISAFHPIHELSTKPFKSTGKVTWSRTIHWLLKQKINQTKVDSCDSFHCSHFFLLMHKRKSAQIRTWNKEKPERGKMLLSSMTVGKMRKTASVRKKGPMRNFLLLLMISTCLRTTSFLLSLSLSLSLSLCVCVCLNPTSQLSTF
jgi:hypothetical protein